MAYNKVSPTTLTFSLLPPEKNITLDYVLEDILMPFQYAQTTYVNAVLSADVYFVFL